ncbi:MAG: hypothetical protein AB9842_06585 [Bacteroidales bacterium]
MMLLSMQNMWFFIATAFFLLLVIALIFNFFKVFMDFIQARGCFAVLLIFLAFLPSVFILCMAAGFTVTSVILLILSTIGAISGYIMRDSEGNVGKFGYFLMIISILTLLITLFLGRLLKFF